MRRFALTLRSSSSGSGLFPRSTLRGKCWPASCLALWQCRALAGDLGERGGLGYRPQSSSPSSATISRLRGRSAIGVTVAGSVASISQWRRAMLTGDKPRAASSCLVSLSKLARTPGFSASASIRARRAAVWVQPGGQAALCGVRQSELQISSSSAGPSLSGHSGIEPCLPSAGNQVTAGPLRRRRRARGSCNGPGMSQS